MKEKKYIFSTCWTESDDDIVFSVFNKNLKVDLATATEIVANRLEFTENKKHYAIFDISHTKHISYEAKLYLQNAETGLKNILGAAFIASNPVSVLLATIFIKTEKKFPANLFSTKKEALNWIIELKNSRSFT